MMGIVKTRETKYIWDERFLLGAMFLFFGLSAFAGVLILYGFIRNSVENLNQEWVCVVTFLLLGLTCFAFLPRHRARSHETLSELLEETGLKGKLSTNDVVELRKDVGLAGFFGRITLTGTPLAVALLVLVCCIVTLVTASFNDQTISKGFLEITKLTIGAFVGSLTTASRAPQSDTPKHETPKAPGPA